MINRCELFFLRSVLQRADGDVSCVVVFDDVWRVASEEDIIVRLQVTCIAHQRSERVDFAVRIPLRARGYTQLHHQQRMDALLQ